MSASLRLVVGVCTAILAVGASMAKPEQADAYRVGPLGNPLRLAINWTPFENLLHGSGGGFPCEQVQTCTQAQKDTYTNARKLGKKVPTRLGTLLLYTAAFEVGWIIGTGLDQRYLHMQERIGGTAPIGTTATASALETANFKVKVFKWTYLVAGATLPGNNPSGYRASTTGYWATWYECSTAGCTPSAPANGASYFANDTTTMDKYIHGALRESDGAFAQGSDAAAEDINNTSGQVVSCGATCTYAGWYRSEASMQAQLDYPTPEPYVSQTTPNTAYGANGTTTSPDPGDMPAHGTPEGDAILDVMLADEPAAIAAAGTAAENDTAAVDGGKGVDPDFEGYEYEVIMPDCAGLTVPACMDELAAAGHGGIITELELDIASADVTRPAGAVVTTSPGASTSIGYTDPVTLNVNPDPLPLTLPTPLPTETYAAWLVRLQALGYVGTITLSTLSETSAVPELGPDAPVSVRIPAIGTTPIRTFALPGGWPIPGPRVYPDTPIEVWKNPDTLPPVNEADVPPATGGPPGGVPTLDFTPITDIDFGCKFPYGFICYAVDVTEWFNVPSDAPSFTFDIPTVSVGAASYGGGDYTVDLNVMDSYMALLRDLMSVALWVGGVYLLAVRLLGFNAGGDPGEAVDEGLNW